MDAKLRDWLLGDDNPGVRVRTLTGLCGLPAEDARVVAARSLVVQTLPQACDLVWMDGKGMALIYGLTALAECGLAREHVAVGPLVERMLTSPFDAACGDMLLLRTLVMLGYATDPRLESRLAQAAEAQLPDGGWLCLHRVRNMGRVPKSCIKGAMHALLLAGELHRRGLSFAGADALLHYFLKRRLFYRTDDPSRLVLDCRPGWRMTDAFFPVEVQRVGLPVLLDALATLGVGRAPELQEAWDLAAQKRDALGRIVLDGTLTKSYLPKERVGKPSKWATLYASLAWQSRAGAALSLTAEHPII